MEPSSSLGLWIKRRRRALDLTQEDLAARVGCAAITLRKIESDERRPSLQIAERLAEQFQLAPDDRTAFLQAVRAELCPDQLIVPPLPLAKPTEIRTTTFLDPDLSTPLIPSPLPSGTLTFLCAEIVDQHTYWEHYTNTLMLALRELRTLLQNTIETSGGIVFQISSTRCNAVFARVADALAATIAIQRTAHQAPLSGNLRLPLRLALHTGTATPIDGDYLAPTARYTARLLAIAHPDQVLLSSTTATLIRDHMPADTLLRDLGQHQLGAQIEVDHLFQLVVPGSPSSFPPLITRRQRANTLPSYTTPLLGREQEIAMIGALLQRPEVRMLTLTGPGGSGKTRLAIQTAAVLQEQFADGVVFVDLSPLRDPALVPDQIARACTITVQAGQTAHEALLTVLRDQELLLVIDNCEHLLAATPLLGELLQQAPRLKVLATSRALLQLRSEHELAVLPLALPDLNTLPSLSELMQYAAIALFVQRTQTILPTFTLSKQNARAVAEICVQLDGLPLAIELAAARSKLLSPQAMLTRLNQRLQLLTSGSRDLPMRQQTLRLAIDWSYELLTPAAQALFRRISIFAGGCTIEAAEAVCADPSPAQTRAAFEREPAVLLPVARVLDELGMLVDQSLLQRVAGDDGAVRFVLLETIREYALERLETAGETALLRDRHVGYYANLAAVFAKTMEGEQPTIWVAQIAVEHANLCAALQWALAQNDGPKALQLCSGAGMFWILHGMWSEGLAWSEAALEIGNEAPLTIQQGGLLNTGWLAALCGDYVKAESYTARALSLARLQRDHTAIAWLLHNLGTIAGMQGHFEQAKLYLMESVAVQQRLPRPFALTLNNLGITALEEYDDQGAERLLIQAVDLAQKVGDQRVLVFALSSLALCYLLTDNIAAANPLVINALRHCQELGGHENLSHPLQDAAGIIAVQGKAIQAAHILAMIDTLNAISTTCLLPRQAAYQATLLDWVRTQLDPDTLAAAWAEGQTLSRTAAIAYALAALEEPH